MSAESANCIFTRVTALKFFDNIFFINQNRVKVEKGHFRFPGAVDQRVFLIEMHSMPAFTSGHSRVKKGRKTLKTFNLKLRKLGAFLLVMISSQWKFFELVTAGSTSALQL